MPIGTSPGSRTVAIPSLWEAGRAPRTKSRGVSLYITIWWSGLMHCFLSFWNTLTNDQFVLQCIKGVKIDFISNIVQTTVPREISCSLAEKRLISSEIKKFLRHFIIERAQYHPEQYVSSIFPRPKRTGGIRIILNLKPLNVEVEYHHFKMENLELALCLMIKNCFMASIDLQDAYYSVNIDPDFRKYFRFKWNNTLYEYTCLPNGLSSAPRIFTKIMKPVFAKLRSEGHMSVYHLDDSWLVAETREDCERNVTATRQLLRQAGFVIHQDISSFTPSQHIQLLGFSLNSVDMTVELPTHKKARIIDMCNTLLQSGQITISYLAQFIGVPIFSLPATQYGALFCRYLEMDKILSLQANKGNFDSFMCLSPASVSGIVWWKDNVLTCIRNIVTPEPTITLTCDASSTAWGCVFKGQTAGGRWSDMESNLHINALELKAIFDNTTAVSYINKLGGVRSPVCHSITKDIWLWAFERCVHLSAAHLPGSENVCADKESRVFDENTEWALQVEVFNVISNKFCPYDIDMFASRLNTKLPIYCAWKPDPGASLIDAFEGSWKTF